MGAGAVLCLLAIFWPAHPAQSITELFETDVEVFKRITITKEEDLHFGTIATRICIIGCANSDGGTVTITPNRTITALREGVTKFTGICSFSGLIPDNFFSVCGSDFWQGRFKLTGTAFASYTITLPGSDTAEGLLVDQFRGMSHTWQVTSSGTVIGQFNSAGNDWVWVGATLTVPSGLTADIYTSFFDITATY